MCSFFNSHGRVIPHIYFLPKGNHDSHEQAANLAKFPGSVSGATLAFGGILSGQKLWPEEQPRPPSNCAPIEQPPRLSPKNTYVNRLPPRWPQCSIAGGGVTRLIPKEIRDSSRRLPHFSRDHGQRAAIIRRRGFDRQDAGNARGSATDSHPPSVPHCGTAEDGPRAAVGVAPDAPGNVRNGTLRTATGTVALPISIVAADVSPLIIPVGRVCPLPVARTQQKRRASRRERKQYEEATS